MRDEASARYERGESSSKTLHSCLQRTNQAWTDTHPERWSHSPWSWHDAWSTSWSSGRGWVESEQSERGHPWWQEVDRHSSAKAPEAAQSSLSDRPLPPTPPTPRRSELDQPSLPAADGGQPTDSATEGAPKVMAAIKSKPRSTRNRSSGHSPRPNAAVLTAEAAVAGTVSGRDASHGQPSAVAKRAAPGNPTNGTRKILRFPRAPKSRALRAAPVRQSQNTPARLLRGRHRALRDPLPVLTPKLESDHAEASRPISMTDPQSKETMASGPHSQASASSGHGHGAGPGASRWTREDTQLSKAMSQLLRHKSNLTLDQAGYAKLSDMLVHPRLRHLNPTLEWVMHIVRLNAKQRFALNEAGTHIRAKQGHSIKVDPSKLLRKLGTGDIGDMIPTCALHSTYFSNVPSIMQIGLLPGGKRGAGYRQHIHLAISHRPDAGLREGSDLILVVDLMKAQKAGCVFYISDNNVVLTADCIPPSCIVRATCTSTGAAFDLSQYRAKYMWGCTASAKLLHVRTLLQIMLTLHATSSHLLLSTCCRCFLPSTFAQPEALFSQPTCCNEQIFSGQSTLTRHIAHPLTPGAIQRRRHAVPSPRRRLTDMTPCRNLIGAGG